MEVIKTKVESKNLLLKALMKKTEKVRANCD